MANLHKGKPTHTLGRSSHSPMVCQRWGEGMALGKQGACLPVCARVHVCVCDQTGPAPDRGDVR